MAESVDSHAQVWRAFLLVFAINLYSKGSAPHYVSFTSYEECNKMS